MISLIPYVRETLRRHLNAKQAVMLTEFDKLKRDYQEHQNEIHFKLVAIMSDRLQVHCRTLEVSRHLSRSDSDLLISSHTSQGIDWEQPSPKVGGPNAYMEGLVKENITLHKVLSRFLQSETVEFIMGQVFAALDARLKEEYGKIEVKSDAAKQRLLADAVYLRTKLGELKGLEGRAPGQVSFLSARHFQQRLTVDYYTGTRTCYPLQTRAGSPSASRSPSAHLLHHRPLLGVILPRSLSVARTSRLRHPLRSYLL
jgi:vacuolar protein sorting-associated protein 54